MGPARRITRKLIIGLSRFRMLLAGMSVTDFTTVGHIASFLSTKLILHAYSPYRLYRKYSLLADVYIPENIFHSFGNKARLTWMFPLWLFATGCPRKKTFSINYMNFCSSNFEPQSLRLEMETGILRRLLGEFLSRIPCIRWDPSPLPLLTK